MGRYRPPEVFAELQAHEGTRGVTRNLFVIGRLDVGDELHINQFIPHRCPPPFFWWDRVRLGVRELGAALTVNSPAWMFPQRIFNRISKDLRKFDLSGGLDICRPRIFGTPIE
jgi:hypothetical protein